MRRIALIFVSVTALFLTTGCGYFFVGTTAPVAGRSVYVFGDSNAAVAGPALISTLGPEYDTLVHGIGGSTTQRVIGTSKAWSRIVRDDLKAKLPSRLVAVVIQLGQNDCSASNFAFITGVPAAIDRIMSVLPRSTPVLWNNIVIPSGNWYCAAMNAFILQATARWPNLIVEDYAGYVGSHRNLMLPTSPHMNAAGRSRYAQWTKQNVRSAVR